MPRETIRDAVGVLGGDPSGHGAVLMAFTPANPTVAPCEGALWTRVAAHLATGYRLVRARTSPVDAVLDPAGRVEHLEAGVSPDERSALSTAARAIEQARGKPRRTDTERAIALWKGLVAGRWTLVDQFDHDGRRYIMAKKNSPEFRAWELLTQRENQVVTYAAHGQSQKVIAYLLGISVASVSALLSKAAGKVGARRGQSGGEPLPQARGELEARARRQGVPARSAGVIERAASQSSGAFALRSARSTARTRGSSPLRRPYARA